MSNKRREGQKKKQQTELGIRVKNQSAIRRLALRNYRDNKKRNHTAVSAIILTTMLFTIVFTLGFGLIKSMEYNTMRMSGGMAHGSFKYLSEEQFERISKHPSIKKIGRRYACGLVRNDALIKRMPEVDCVDQNAADMAFLHVDEGHFPESYDEVVLDTVTLDLLKIPHKIGEKVTLDIESFRGEGVSKSYTFTLSGYYVPDKGSTAAFVLVSREFVKKEFGDRGQQYQIDYDSTGSISAEVMFANSRGIEENMQKVITESGYYLWNEEDQVPIGMDGKEASKEERKNCIEYGVNWAYMNASMDQNNLMAGIIVCLISTIFVFTGYLIIYNIFQISVIRDIRFFGLLKTIGTTKKQIRSILLLQAFRMCIWGIPGGLIVGYVLGLVFLPLITSQLYGGETYASMNPLIFIGSSLFALITVLISCKKPAKVASSISPVEAVKYNGVEQSYIRKKKTSTDGAKVWRMAFSNLGRNRKRTVIAVISMALGLILMNLVATISNSFDMDNFLKRFVSFDFQIAHASYFNLDYLGDVSGMETPDEAVKVIESQQGFLEGGSLYTLSDLLTHRLEASYKGSLTDRWSGITTEYDGENDFIRTIIYGMDAFYLNHLKLFEGSCDVEKFLSGEGIFLGLDTNDYGVPYMDNALYKVGEKVKIKEVLEQKYIESTFDADGRETPIFQYVFGAEKEYEVLGYYEINQNNSRRMYGEEITIAMADTELASWGYPITRMLYSCQVKENASIADFEHFFQDYTKNVNPMMNYISRETFKGEFDQMQKMLLGVGGTIAGVIGLIGILNFLNSMSTSILTRRKEFAMLKSIGMTGGQLKRMLILEGLYYAMFTVFLSLFFSIAFSFTVLSRMEDILWLLKFHPTFLPLLLAYPLLFLLAVAIPLLNYHSADQESIVEQLHTAE